MWKVFDAKSWSALLSSLAQIKGTADASASAVSGVGEDLAKLSQITTQELARKQDKAASVAVTIPTSGWGADSTAKYPNYYDIAASGVTAKDRVSVDLSAAAQGTAVVCGLCPVCETLDGKIRLRAASVPTVAMAANYWIEKGA